MHITTDAIVLRERAADDFDSVLTLLTKERGVITAYARGAKKPRGSLTVSAALLSYSCFVLFSSRDRFSVDKADLTRAFMGIRGDLEKLALASYFCELTAEIAPHEQAAEEYLRLLLNSLHLLDKGLRTREFVKPVYELRLMTMAGYMPSLVACRGCSCFKAEQMFFLPQSGELLCGDCAAEHPDSATGIPLAAGVLAAMRHIIYSENGSLFGFSLAPPALEALGTICEHYVMVQVEKRFDTLDFYQSLAMT